MVLSLCKTEVLDTKLELRIIMSNSLPLENSSEYESLMQEYHNLIVAPWISPSILPEINISTSLIGTDGVNAKKIVTDEQVDQVKVLENGLDTFVNMSINHDENEKTFTPTNKPCDEEGRNVKLMGHSNDIGDWLVAPEISPSNLTEINVPTSLIGTDNLNVNKIVSDEQVNQVKVSENGLDTSVTMSINHDGSEKTFIPTNKPCDKGGRSVRLMDHSNNMGDWLVAPEISPSNLTEINIPTSLIGTTDEQVDQVKVSENGLDTSVNMSINHDGSEKTFIPTNEPCDKAGGNVEWMGHSNDMGDARVKSKGSKGVNNATKKRRSFSNGYFNSELFGSYQEVMNALAKPVSSYDLLYEHPSVQKSFAPSKKKKANVPNRYAIVKATFKPKLEPKKVNRKEAFRFPHNVRTLTGTGMFDGVPVRYVSLSQEKLRGIIKGAGYLCGCDSCKFSKTLNAYEFEHHAGCKSSHPNNHIRFQNGKTIHQIVKELKNTPDHRLFDAILTVTGSSINQSAYIAWKESYLAANRRLERMNS